MLAADVRAARNVLVGRRRLVLGEALVTEEDRIYNDIVNQLFTRSTPAFIPSDSHTIESLDFIYSDGFFCCICQEDDEGRAVLLECNHVYHENCIKDQLRVNGRCPMCRRLVGHTEPFRTP